MKKSEDMSAKEALLPSCTLFHAVDIVCWEASVFQQSPMFRSCRPYFEAELLLMRLS